VKTRTLNASKKTKRTPIGEIPVEWEVRELHEVATVQTGVAMGKKNIVDPIVLPYLRVANVQDGYLDLREVKAIAINRSELTRYALRNDDVLLTEGGDLDKLGRGHIWHAQIDPCLHQNHIFAVRVAPTVLSPKFLVLHAAGPLGRRYFLACAKQTTNLASINSSQLKAFPVVLPSKKEQERIVARVDAWSAAISQTEARLDLKARLRSALMQQLLTGKRRFPRFGKRAGKSSNDWKWVHLGDVFDERLEVGRIDLPLLSITADRGVINRNDLEKKDTSSEDKSKYLRIAPGDIGYNTMRMWQGVSALSTLEGIVSPAYTVCTPKADVIDGRFAAFLFKSRPVIHLFRRYSQGMVDDTLNLKFHNFAQIRIRIPGLDEQRAIAEVLSVCDSEINLLTRQLAALRRQKAGLMQQLLTGKIRVKG